MVDVTAEDVHVDELGADDLLSAAVTVPITGPKVLASSPSSAVMSGI